MVKSMVSISLLVDNPMLPYSEEISCNTSP